jgi:eukaryotic-like serine/threonine-protein kinase
LLKWKYGFSQPVYSCPTVSGGAVYVYCAANLVCLDTATGALKWQYYTNDLVNSVQSPTVANGLVYQSTLLGSFTVGALNAATGTLVWSYRGGICRSNPAVVNGVIYTGDEGYTLVALDAGTGVVKWRYYHRDHGGSTSPTVAAGKVFIGDYDGSIYAFDSAAGTLQWKFASNGIQYMGYQNATGITVGLWSSPVYANGIVFAGNNDGENYAINATTGKSAWTWGNTLSANPAATQATVANGIVIFGTTTGQVLALDAASGGVKWTFQTKAGVYSGACIVGADGTVWHPGESGDTQ